MGRIPDDLRQIIADNIRKCRIKKFPGRGGGKKCAEAFKVSPQQWSPWERGNRTPDEDRMNQIAKFFGVTVAYLRQDRRNQPGGSPFLQQSHTPHESPPSHGETNHGDSPLLFDDLPQIGAAPQPGAPPLTGPAPHPGADTYWLLARFCSQVSHGGIIVRLAPQDMDYLGNCIAQALIRHGVVFPKKR